MPLRFAARRIDCADIAQLRRRRRLTFAATDATPVFATPREVQLFLFRDPFTFSASQPEENSSENMVK